MKLNKSNIREVISMYNANRHRANFGINIIGLPGNGKVDAIEEAAKKVNDKVFTYRLASIDISDIKNADIEGSIVILDEVNRITPSIMGEVTKIMDEYRGRTLFILSTTGSDEENYFSDLPTPILNRIAHFVWEPDTTKYDEFMTQKVE